MLVEPDDSVSVESNQQDNLTDMADFSIKVDLLPKGTFANYISQKQAEGADLAHLKPPHVNPSEKILSVLIAETEETIIGLRESNPDIFLMVRLSADFSRTPVTADDFVRKVESDIGRFFRQGLRYFELHANPNL